VIEEMKRAKRRAESGVAPTTDEGLPVLLENKGLSIAVYSVVLWRLEKKISN
jgi:hypothetical protein